MTTTRAALALQMARSGLPVFPCLANEKRPATHDGLRAATTNVKRVEQWWSKHPQLNIGLATGHGLVVVDCDNGKPWPHTSEPPAGVSCGADLLIVLAETHGATVDASWFWETWSVRTPSGGLHLYYLLPDGVRVPNSAGRIGAWIDVRGDGGYVVAPGSELSSGSYRPIWGWEEILHSATVDRSIFDFDHPPLPIPAWLLDLALGKRAAQPDPWLDLLARLDAPSGGDMSRYASAALNGELDRVRSAVFGTRNDTLNRAAFQLGTLVGAGLLDEQTAARELLTASAVCGLDEVEAQATIRSGLTKGMDKPRVVAC